jgi:hypothetical protein
MIIRFRQDFIVDDAWVLSCSFKKDMSPRVITSSDGFLSDGFPIENHIIYGTYINNDAIRIRV